jgi:hypothetical protein
MKISIEVDCTPEEARRFLGLPDVAPMQAALVEEMQKRLSANVASMDPDQLLKTWLPAGMQGLEQVQRAFWAQMSRPADTDKPSKGGED